VSSQSRHFMDVSMRLITAIVDFIQVIDHSITSENFTRALQE